MVSQGPVALADAGPWPRELLLRAQMSEPDVKCPFCNEDGFDKVGLKYHLIMYCEAYQNTLSIDEERELRMKDGTGSK